MVDTRTAAPPTARPKTRSRPLVIAYALAGLLVTNLIVYAMGRALGGDFTYTQDGVAVLVDPLATVIMSLGPLLTGLAVIALLARRWPVAVRIGRIAGPALAVITIGVMTIPAGFDTTSAIALSAMHLATIPAMLVALNALARRQGEGRQGGGR
jgi:Family of unknown function (DUF6069)